MTLALSARNKLAASTARRADIDLASTPGVLKLYPSPRPATGAAAGVTLLATIVFSDPCGTVDAAGLHLTSPAPAQAVAAGIIRWGRIEDGDGNFVMDGDVRMAADSDVAIADILIDVAQVYVGSFVNLTSAVIAEGG